MLLNTFRSEFTKLRTTRSFWWTTAIFLVLAWGWAAMVAGFASSGLEGVGALNTAVVPMGAQFLGVAVIMIQAIMVVTTEYRYNLQGPTYMANPNRLMVAAVKYVLYALIAAALAFIGLVGAFLIADMLGKGAAGDMFKPFEDEVAKRSLWAFPAGVAVVVLFAQGLGLLMRQTAGAVAVSLIFFLGIDQLISLVPKIGKDLVHFSPFGGLQNWINDYAPGDAPWGDNVYAYGLVFLAWGLVLWLGGLILLISRDA